MSFNVLSINDGIGACYSVFENFNKKIGNYYAYETDEQAVKVALANHPKIIECGNAEKEDFSKYQGKIDCLIGTGNVPCFAGETLVLTNQGYKRIDEVRVGDMVLTHKGRFRRVLDVGSKSAETYLLRTAYNTSIQVTKDHPFYVRNENGMSWKSISEATVGSDELCLAFDINNEINISILDNLNYEQLRSVGICFAKGSTKGLQSNNKMLKDTVKYCWLKENTPDNQENEHYHFRKRNIPVECFKLNKKKLQQILTGYLSASDLQLKQNLFYIEYGIEDYEIVNSLIFAFVKAYGVMPKIEERFSAEKGTYFQLVFPYKFWSCETEKNVIEGEGKAFIDTYFLNNYRKIDTVYNLSVEEDESYTANNLIVHNCKKETNSAFEVFKKAIRAIKPKCFVFIEDKNIGSANKKQIVDFFGFAPTYASVKNIFKYNSVKMIWAGAKDGINKFRPLWLNLESNNFKLKQIIDYFNGFSTSEINKSQNNILQFISDSISDTEKLFVALPDITNNCYALKHHNNLFHSSTKHKYLNLSCATTENCVAIPIVLKSTVLLKEQLNLSLTQKNKKTFVDTPNNNDVNSILLQSCNPESELGVYEVKSNYLYEFGKNSPVCHIRLPDGAYYIRELTLIEYFRLKGMPVEYDLSTVEEREAKKMVVKTLPLDLLGSVLLQTTIKQHFKQNSEQLTFDYFNNRRN